MRKQHIINGIRMAALASAVPENIRTAKEDAELFGADEVAKISDSIGVKQRHVAKELCTSDLCYAAAETVFSETGIDRNAVGAVIFISQSPDYRLPATSCVLHARLNLSKGCIAFDINMGCSGYVYGLWVVASLMAGGAIEKALLLVGDTSTRMTSPFDRSVALLFGDAGTATLLEKNSSAAEMRFVFGTDGTGKDNLIIPAGGFRKPSTEQTHVRTEREGGNIRNDEELFMDGAEIFTFCLTEVPPMFKALVTDLAAVDAVVMHQANKFLLDYLAKRLKIPSEKMIVGMEHFGNTSSASIPLTMTSELAPRLRSEKIKLALAGFGVGYSFGAVTMECGPMVVPNLVIVPEKAFMANEQGGN